MYSKFLVKLKQWSFLNTKTNINYRVFCGIFLDKLFGQNGTITAIFEGTNLIFKNHSSVNHFGLLHQALMVAY